MIISPEDFENGNFAKLRFNWVKYIPELKGISTNGLLVFTYLREWWKTNAKEKGEDASFYKFLEPCEADLYREGDSITEQLPTISAKQFRKEFDKLGVRHKSERQFKNCENPFLEGDGQEKFFCSYRRQDNTTHYVVNKKLMNQRMREAQEKFEIESFGTDKRKVGEEPKGKSQTDKREIPNGQKGCSSISTNTTKNTTKNTTVRGERARGKLSSFKNFQNEDSLPNESITPEVLPPEDESKEAHHQSHSWKKENSEYGNKSSDISLRREKEENQSPFESEEEEDRFFLALKKYIKVTAKSDLTEGRIASIATATYRRLSRGQGEPDDRYILREWKEGRLELYMDDRVESTSYRQAETLERFKKMYNLGNKKR